MKKPAKLMILLACGFLLAIFFLPIWHIKLNAPQYPGGLDMYIWINKITGTDEFTLQNINILNHYIGMQPIYPDSFKELKIMPFVVAFLVLFGLIIAYLNQKRLLVAWLVLLVVGGAIGLVDFYLWQQAFGNDLDPNAPIKVEGMTYSPPFLGTKILLNIEASSYPSWGGLFFTVALLLVGGAILYDKLKRTSYNLASVGVASIVVGSSFLSSCKPEPHAIDYGFDSCTHCKMTISDQRYGTELVTKKGKVYKFDAIECMVKYLQGSTQEYAFQLVTDFERPDEFIDAQQAWYLQSPHLPSPMGMNLSAFEDEDVVENLLQVHEGRKMDWTEVLQMELWK